MSSFIIKVVLVSSEFISSIYNFCGEYVGYLEFVWNECCKWKVNEELVDKKVCGIINYCYWEYCRCIDYDEECRVVLWFYNVVYSFYYELG